MKHWKTRTGWYFTGERAMEDIGEGAFRKVCKLISKHYGASPPYEFRAAPSIICRSEIEMLGVAAPRFAFRTLIRSGNKVGFLNCRRLDVLASQLQHAISTRWNPETKQLEQLDPVDFEKAVAQLRKRIERSSPFAESILPVPRIFDDYHVIARNYSDLFGETERIEGTPFVNAIELGGGLCSQGACFMATLMRIDDAVFVHGPSEITALLDPEIEPRQIKLTGMKLGDFVKYFRHELVGLNSYWETGAYSSDPAIQLNPKTLRDQGGINLCLAIRNYVLSDVPVIALVDASEYCKRILTNKQNQIPAQVDGDEKHCVLIVGVGKSVDRSTRLLAHDPSIGAPWVQMSVDELVRCTVESGKNCVYVFPVLPKAVTLHLLPSRPEMPAGNYNGLLRLAQTVQRDRILGRQAFGDAVDRLPVIHRGSRQPDAFHLVDLQQIRDGIVRPRDREMCWNDETLLDRVAQEFLPDHHWAWMQRCRHFGEKYSRSLWIWNAESTGEGHQGDLAKCLLLVIVNDAPITDAPWCICWRSPTETSGRGAANSAESDSGVSGRSNDSPVQTVELKRSLITSFLPTSMRVVGEVWPNDDEYGTVACELYGFMIPDRKYIVAKSTRPKSSVRNELESAPLLHETLDLLRHHPECVESLASELTNLFPVAKRPIVAIASYIPEISNPAASASARAATGTLNCLCKLALALKRLGHPLVAVEIVAGSRVAGIDWMRLIEDLATGTTRPDLTVTIESQEQAFAWATEAIGSSVNDVRYELEQNRIAMALELEPGMFFILRDLEAAEEFLRRADRAGLDKLVGINLDIGHFLMARHLRRDGVAWDAALDRLKPRLVHCHISQHSRKGHFGDSPLSLPALRNEELELLDVYRSAVRDRDALPISRYVSLELEAAVAPDAIETSLQTLGRFVGQDLA